MKHLVSSSAVSESDISVVDCPYLSRPPQALVDLLTGPEGNTINLVPCMPAQKSSSHPWPSPLTPCVYMCAINR